MDELITWDREYIICYMENKGQLSLVEEVASGSLTVGVEPFFLEYSLHFLAAAAALLALSFTSSSAKLSLLISS
jgi:hypothetical protein